MEGVVHRQIGYPRRNSIMPADLVAGDDARDVAAYVAEVAGIPGEDTGELAEVGVQEGGKATAENGVLQIDADETGALAFTASTATAPPGRIEFVMDNPSPIDHNIALEGGPEGDVVGNGGTSQFETNLKPGKYAYLCTVPGPRRGRHGGRGHRQVAPAATPEGRGRRRAPAAHGRRGQGSGRATSRADAGPIEMPHGPWPAHT